MNEKNIAENMSAIINIECELRSMFVRANVLIRKLYKCSDRVKLVLFNSYCICRPMYDVALWQKLSSSSLAG